ncbi:hypothetical protein J45TS6_28630 [Paenibacillus sp. J45TS6]|nr:hypothetical protein J45TS6_28630 [Paenibacillus sp. J45TS6]
MQVLLALREKASPWELSFPMDAELENIQVYYGFDNLTFFSKEFSFLKTCERANSPMSRWEMEFGLAKPKGVCF